MNVVEDLFSLKSGLLAGRNFRLRQSTKRVSSLRLSNFQEIENSHAAGINSIDLDKVEGR